MSFLMVLPNENFRIPPACLKVFRCPDLINISGLFSAPFGFYVCHLTYKQTGLLPTIHPFPLLTLAEEGSCTFASPRKAFKTNSLQATAQTPKADKQMINGFDVFKNLLWIYSNTMLIHFLM